MLRLAIFFLGFLAVQSQPSFFMPPKNVNPAVTALNISQYVGTWLEVYADAAVLNSFEKDGFCTTARYEDRMDGSISVHNYQRKFSPMGLVSEIFGRAYAPDKSKPGELVVQFNNMTRLGSYWVIGLGPVVNDKYDWAIVSDNLSYTLFILTRDTKRFEQLYETDVLNMTKTMGYIPISTYQGDDCIYSPDMMITMHDHPMMSTSAPVHDHSMMSTSAPSPVMSIPMSTFPTYQPTYEPSYEPTPEPTYMMSHQHHHHDDEEVMDEHST